MSVGVEQAEWPARYEPSAERASRTYEIGFADPAGTPEANPEAP